MRYKAFISYRHGGTDEKVAVQVQREIEKYRLPGKLAKKLGEKRVGRVFRDAEELRAASDLSAVIREALDESEWLIVIASPRYLESPWCLEELDYFLALRGRDRVLVVLTEGEPADSFPSQLTCEQRDGAEVKVEPLAVDVRGTTPEEAVKMVKQERFRLLATMLDVAYDDLRQRQRERRTKRIAAALTAAFVILGSVIGVVTVKNIQLNQAYDALDASNRETLQGQSYYLAEYADEAHRNGDQMTSLLLSLEALPKDLSHPDRPFVPRVMRSLTDALGIYDYEGGYRPGAFFEREGETYDIRTQVSADGRKIRIESYAYAAGNILTREVQVCSLPDGKELCRYRLSDIIRGVDHPEGNASCMTRDGSRLFYLAPDGLRCVETETGKEIFHNTDKADELKLGAKENTIVSIDYEGHHLYSYDGSGEPHISAEIGEEMNYTLGEISPEEKEVSFAANTEDISGVITVNLEQGETRFIDMPGLCTAVGYIDENRLCFLLADETDGLKHIVQYDVTKGTRGYLCNADWELASMTMTDRETCLYSHDNRVYEVDCNSKKGKKIWEQVFSSNVVSVKAGGNVIAVSCRDGSVTYFEAESKNRIDVQPGNGEAFTLLTVDDRLATLRDYWGKELRVAVRQDRSDESVLSLKESSAIAEPPERWFTCGAVEGVHFSLGFRSDAKDRIATFALEKGVDGRFLPSFEGGVDIGELGLSSFDNLAIEQRGYVWIQDYDSDRILHIDNINHKIIMEINDDDHYFYDETGTLLFITDSESGKHVLKTYEAATGKETGKEVELGSDDRGLKVGDSLVTGDDESIRIQKPGASPVEIPDAVLYGCNLGRGVILYRSVDEKQWTVYDVEKGRSVLEGESGVYTNTIFFGENRYLLNDYSKVFDMETWEEVLDVSELGSSVYGVMTTKNLPYFVVWCQEQGTTEGDRSYASGKAYLYAKAAQGESEDDEIVGEIPGFVTMAPDGEILVHDGQSELYSFPLLTSPKLKERAEQLVGDRSLSEGQRRRYHLPEGRSS